MKTKKSMKFYLFILLFMVGNINAISQLYSISSILNATNEVPTNASGGTGMLTGTYNQSTKIMTVNVIYVNLSSPLSVSHLHSGAIGTNGPVIINLSPLPGTYTGTFTGTYSFPQTQESSLLSGNIYVNIHTTAYVGGEIRGQLSLKPIAQLELTMGDLYLNKSYNGVILKSPSGSCYRIKVADNGTLTTTLVSCP